MFKIRTQDTAQHIACAHCGDPCPDSHPQFGGHDFCCNGCQVIYEVLHKNGLGDYYAFAEAPGISQRSALQKNLAFLDDDDVVQSLLEFREEHVCKISFTLPQIHCSSCIWLLENLNKLNPGILGSRVNFLRKSATISYNPREIRLREVVELLTKIGYAPELNLQKLSDAKNPLHDRSLYYKLGLAGFSFGNIMLLSFPEYLGFEQASVKFYIGYINILLSLPVLLYSGIDYLRSAMWTLRMRQINIDIPIAVGMLTLFFRSVFEIVSQTGEGYLDSLAGFIFFLLIGKWFQHYTFYSIAFDRNYKSYFPISAMVQCNDGWESRSLEKLVAGDVILVRNEEIIPGDGLLMQGNASIDYSFVTGEADIIHKVNGDKIFAGGKNMGSHMQLQLLRNPDQSYLTKLWDEDAFRIDKEARTQTLIAQIGRYFTLTIVSVAIFTLIYWLMYDTSIAFNAFTAVLIVACPCALALALPFSYGNILRIMGKKQMYIKNVQVIDRIQQVDEIIFDKTGTITDNKQMQASISGKQPDKKVTFLIKSAVFQSNHPLSKAIFNTLEGPFDQQPDYFQEIAGKGIIAGFGKDTIRVGSPDFLRYDHPEHGQDVIAEINGTIETSFQVSHQFREGIEHLIQSLGSQYQIGILSGDNNREEKRLRTLFPAHTTMIFNQSPMDKLNYVRERQRQGHRVLMFGDGLNDAGALMQSNVGIVISDDSNNFTPACDAILGAQAFRFLPDFLNYLQKSRLIILGAFMLAFLYNVAGLYFAVRGALSPVVAAILMPLSSVTVISYGLISSAWLAQKLIRNSEQKKPSATS